MHIILYGCTGPWHHFMYSLRTPIGRPWPADASQESGHRLSHIRDAALRLDLSGTLWRVAQTQDGKEFRDLLLEQLRWLVERYPEDSAQYANLKRLIAIKEAQ